MHPLVYLSCYPKINIRRLNLMAGYFLSLNQIIDTSNAELLKVGLSEEIAEDFINWKNKFPVEKMNDILIKENIETVVIDEDNYPELLAQIPDPPVVLFYRGQLPEKNETALSVVGSRKITNYGKIIIEKIITPLVSLKTTIISGLALGVDALAHEIAVKNNSKTIAILGGGIDKKTIYPQANFYLSEKIIANGGALISEYPPFFKPAPYTFPARNRIIAGLTKATLIIEAPKKSGALITAHCALDYNREVLAVPHPINSPQGEGCNNLIKNGATIITEVEDIFEFLNLEKSESTIDKNSINLSLAEQKILNIINHEPQHLDDIIEKSKIEKNEITALVTILEIKGLIKNNGAMRYYK